MKSIKEDAQLQTEEMKYLAELIMAQMDGRMPLPVPMDIEVKQLIRYAMDAHTEFAYKIAGQRGRKTGNSKKTDVQYHADACTGQCCKRN